MGLLLTSSGIGNPSINDALVDLPGKPISESRALCIPIWPTVNEDVWTAAVQETDALLVWGGDPLYPSYWMRQSGPADLLPSLWAEAVYVGVSAEAMAATSTLGETYLSITSTTPTLP